MVQIHYKALLHEAFPTDVLATPWPHPPVPVSEGWLEGRVQGESQQLPAERERRSCRICSVGRWKHAAAVLLMRTQGRGSDPAARWNLQMKRKKNDDYSTSKDKNVRNVNHPRIYTQGFNNRGLLIIIAGRNQTCSSSFSMYTWEF